MTALAERILAEFDSLDPQEQVLVRNRVLSVTQERQRKALERLIGSSHGKNLLGKLLEERKRERARG
jgi:hypothetical protein